MAWNKYAEDFDSCVNSIYNILFLEDNKFNRENVKFMVGGIVDIKKEYLMSEDAYNIISVIKPSLIISENKAKYAKGFDDITIEHMIPSSVVVRYLYEHKEEFRNIENLKEFLRPLTCALISKAENKKLEAAGLRQAMPIDWSGNTMDITARYRVAGIKIRS